MVDVSGRDRRAKQFWHPSRPLHRLRPRVNFPSYLKEALGHSSSFLTTTSVPAKHFSLRKDALCLHHRDFASAAVCASCTDPIFHTSSHFINIQRSSLKIYFPMIWLGEESLGSHYACTSNIPWDRRALFLRLSVTGAMASSLQCGTELGKLLSVSWGAWGLLVLALPLHMKPMDDLSLALS